MTDSTLEIQKAVVATLKADGAVAALVGARVYDAAPQGPDYPLIELGASVSEPWEGTTMDGWELFQTINVWSQKPGAVEALQIAAAVNAALRRVALTLDTQAYVLGSLDAQNKIPQSDGRTTLVAMRFRFLTHP